MRDIYFMSIALAEAIKAAEKDEVPVGCVIAYRNQLIARGQNARNTQKNALKHAEIDAIDAACKFMGDWRLEGCTLYVTTEPCPMCAGAIIQARITRVVYGTANKKAGCAGSVLDILNCKGLNHRAEVLSGVLACECASLMSGFFTDFRRRANPQAHLLDR